MEGLVGHLESLGAHLEGPEGALGVRFGGLRGHSAPGGQSKRRSEVKKEPERGSGHDFRGQQGRHLGTWGTLRAVGECLGALESIASPTWQS